MIDGGHRGQGRLRHQAVFHTGPRHFVDQAATFALAGLAAGEPVMALVSTERMESLADALGGAAGAVSFLDLARIGGNPARLIPVWQQFLSSAASVGKRCRGIGESGGLCDGEAARAECWQHEALVNVAFDTAAFTLMCSYDRSALGRTDLESARSHHPFLYDGGRSIENEHFRPARSPWLSGPVLESPPPRAESMPFDGDSLGDVRAFVAARAALTGTVIPPGELVIAVNEVATNSVLHAGGHGDFLIWAEPEELVCEIRDSGLITDPLVGRRRPRPDSSGGRGLWIANQLCDLVQVRSGPEGTVVRLRARTVSQAGERSRPFPRRNSSRDSVRARRL